MPIRVVPGGQPSIDLPEHLKSEAILKAMQDLYLHVDELENSRLDVTKEADKAAEFHDTLLVLGARGFADILGGRISVEQIIPHLKLVKKSYPFLAGVIYYALQLEDFYASLPQDLDEEAKAAIITDLKNPVFNENLVVNQDSAGRWDFYGEVAQEEAFLMGLFAEYLDTLPEAQVDTGDDAQSRAMTITQISPVQTRVLEARERVAAKTASDERIATILKQKRYVTTAVAAATAARENLTIAGGFKAAAAALDDEPVSATADTVAKVETIPPPTVASSLGNLAAEKPKLELEFQPESVGPGSLAGDAEPVESKRQTIRPAPSFPLDQVDQPEDESPKSP